MSFGQWTTTSPRTEATCTKSMSEKTFGKWPKDHSRRYSDDGSGCGSDQEDRPYSSRRRRFTFCSRNKTLSPRHKRIDVDKLTELVLKVATDVDFMVWHELSEMCVNDQFENMIFFFKKNLRSLKINLKTKLSEFNIKYDENVFNQIMKIHVLCHVLTYTFLNVSVKKMTDEEKGFYDEFLNFLCFFKNDFNYFCENDTQQKEQILFLLKVRCADYLLKRSL